MYHSGQSAIPVKPVTRRVTFTRGMPQRVGKRYLQKTGRRPLNRIGYPVMGTPVAADMALEPGRQLGGVNDPIMLAVRTRTGRRFETRPYDPASSVALGSSDIIEDVRTRSGRRFSTHPYDPRSAVFGASILDPLSITSNFTPSIPSVVVAPPSDSGSWWNPVAAVVNLWNNRPQVVKDIKIRVNPVKAAQQVLSPAQMQAAVDYARSMGLDPSYQGVPITGAGANAGYRIAGMDLGQYLPWIAGGAALLFLAPMLMRRK